MQLSSHRPEPIVSMFASDDWLLRTGPSASEYIQQHRGDDDTSRHDLFRRIGSTDLRESRLQDLNDQDSDERADYAAAATH